MKSMLQIFPRLIAFAEPKGEPQQRELKLKNITKNTVAYKVKTNAPTRYCVRPNYGLLLPGRDCEVVVTLSQSVTNVEVTQRDKFLIVATYVPSPEIQDKIEQARMKDRQLFQAEITKMWNETPPGWLDISSHDGDLK